MQAPRGAWRGAAFSAGWRALGERAAARFARPHTLFIEGGRVMSWSAEHQAADPEEAASAAAWFGSHRGAAVRVVLSSTLTRQIVADPALPLDDPALLSAWARQQFATYHGAAAQGWPVAPWLLAGQRGVCALPQFDLSALRREAAEGGVRLRSVEPWWSVALAAASAQVALLEQASAFSLGLVEGSLLTVLTCDGGRVASVVQRRLGSASSDALVGVLAESLLDTSVDATSDRHVCVLGFGLADSGPWPASWQVPDRLDAPVPARAWLHA